MTGLTRFLVAVAVLAALAVLVSSSLVANLWRLLTDGGSGGYFIPAESSVFTFRETLENPGSGGWWLRGEDRRNLYAILEDEAEYAVFPKAAIPRCRGFVESDPSSWCSEFRESSRRQSSQCRLTTRCSGR